MSYRIYRKTALTFAVLVSFVPFVAACSKKDDCFGQSNGKTYHVTIIEKWGVDSQYSGSPGELNPCPADLDLIAGNGFDLQIKGFNSDATGCSCGQGIIVASPAEWVWDNSSGAEGRCTANFFSATNLSANRGECEGQVALGVETSRLPSGSSVVGQAPVAHVNRTFTATSADAGACLSTSSLRTCNDSFVVEIAER
jgi:hypothetical protein